MRSEIWPFRLLCVFAGLLLLASCSSANQIDPKETRVSLADLSIQFEPNYGQAEPGVLFLARSPQLALMLRAREFTLRTTAGNSESATLSVRFLNSNDTPKLAGSHLEMSQTNYLVGRDPSHWHTHIPNFARVIYSALYPGIDAVFYGKGQELEHDFVVQPGADYRAIRMRLLGSQKTVLQPDGRIRIRLATGDLFFANPSAYQVVAGKKHSLPGSFVVVGKDEIAFQIGDYDHSRPLVIDPVLTYSTFLANFSIAVSAVAVDSSGSAFLTGDTASSSFPTTPGAFQPACQSCPNNNAVFISKFTPDGTALIYSTLLGGSDNTQSYGIAADGNGNAIIVGSTQSTDFPLKNPIDYGPGAVGTGYAFVTSLSADGSSLNYSSILGGAAQSGQSSVSGTTAVTVDADGNAYIVGGTNSPIFPVTAGALNVGQPGYPATTEFVMKFASNGSLMYSSLPGVISPPPGVSGAGNTTVSAIAVDNTGSLYLTGNGGSLWPTTPGAYQTQIPGTSPYSATFVTKLAADASRLVYSTFIGSGEAATGIAVVPNGEAIAVGSQAPSTFPTTSNAFQPAVPANACCAGYLSKLSADGSQLVYSTFFSGNLTTYGPWTNIWGVALDKDGNIWIAGNTSDPQLPLVQPLQSVPGPLFYPAATGFVSQFDSTGTKLKFSTYFGGLGGGVWPVGPVLDGQGKVHIAGTANYLLYASPGAYLATVTTNPDYAYGFAASIDPSVASPAMCVAYPANQGLSFGPIPAATSANRTLQIQNCGTLPLSVSSFLSSSPVFTIPTSGNGCAQQVAVNASCTLTITFTPATINTSYSGTLTISGNASMPLVMPLTGVGAATLGLSAPGSSGNATVTAGGTATYTVNIGGGGIGGTAMIACAGAPAYAVCSAPATVTVDTSIVSNFSVTVSTATSSKSQLVFPGSSMHWLWATAIFGLFVAPMSLRRRRFRLLGIEMIVVIAALTLISCGGGPSGSPGSGGSAPGGTPPGTYTLTLTATAGSSTESLPLTLKVQ